MTAGSSSGYYGNLRARGRDFSKKINSKSSRDIIYENEELRLKTMYINAEVEQGIVFIHVMVYLKQIIDSSE